MKKRILSVFLLLLLAGLTACGDVTNIVGFEAEAKHEISDDLVEELGEETIGLKPYLMQSMTSGI